MNFLSRRFIIAAIASGFLLSPCAGAPPEPTAQQPARMHNRTDWQIAPSFKFDTLCFLNTLTGDSYYLDYYKEEYAKFDPKLTPAARKALANLKRKIKDEDKNIISAFLCLYFSATDDKTLDDMLRTLHNSERMRANLRKTTYYSESGWQLYESVREDLKTVFSFLRQIRFENYWRTSILPKTMAKISEIEKDLPKYNVIAEDEMHLGFALPSNTITVYVLYYSQPHGIKITGTRFLTDVAWPLRIVLRNAVHEMMHPPYQPAGDRELRAALDSLKADDYLMDKVRHHNPSFGYNSFDGFIEEDCVQALEQVVNERLKIEREAHKRWQESDDRMHVFAVALYSIMKKETFNQKKESFRDFLIRMIRSERLSPGKIKTRYDAFYSRDSSLR